MVQWLVLFPLKVIKTFVHVSTFPNTYRKCNSGQFTTIIIACWHIMSQIVQKLSGVPSLLQPSIGRIRTTCILIVNMTVGLELHTKFSHLVQILTRPIFKIVVHIPMSQPKNGNWLVQKIWRTMLIEQKVQIWQMYVPYLQWLSYRTWYPLIFIRICTFFVLGFHKIIRNLCQYCINYANILSVWSSYKWILPIVKKNLSNVIKYRFFVKFAQIQILIAMY